MLFQVADYQFLVIKKTWPKLVLLSTGALVNVALNLLLIPRLGIEGASVATMLGYVVSDVICVSVLVKMKLQVVSKRFIAVVLIFATAFCSWRLIFLEMSWGFTVVLALLTSACIAWLYRAELSWLVKSLSKTDNV